MVTLSHAVFCALTLMVLHEPSNVVGQRGGYVPPKKTKPVQPAPVMPVVPETDDLEEVPVGVSQSLSGSLRVKGTTDEEAMLRIEELENAMSTMKRENIEMQQALTNLQMTSISLQRNMRVLATKTTELEKLANQNTELTRLLVYFETFFGVLYSEAPEAFDSNIPVETRLSKLAAYLGNRDAVMAGIRPKPPVTIEPDNTGVSDEVATAVIQLSQENAALATKVQTLEADVATTNAEVKSAKASKSGAFGSSGTCTCGEDVQERVERLESTTANLLVPYLNSVSAPSSASSKKAGSVAPIITEDEINELRSSLIESRAVSDTRKSCFSAIRHKHMIGDDERQVLTFDSVHINKGRNFKNNSLFVCTTEGFYFFHFTVRSYDGHYMGVALVKNNDMMTSIYTDFSERSVMQSQSIVLHMQKGDMVWLELGASERFAVYSDIHKYITFNGFLIYKGR